MDEAETAEEMQAIRSARTIKAYRFANTALWVVNVLPFSIYLEFTLAT